MFAKTLNKNSAFIIPYFVLLICLLPVLLLYTKSDIHLWINRYHSGFTDVLFALLTYLGDGLFLIIPAVILLFFSLRHFVFLLTAYFGSGLVTQILKRLIFDDVMRPSRYLQDKGLHLVEGVQLLHGRSFPSGHATSAFALFLCLAMISSDKYIKFLCFVVACLVAFSRVYLSQHFLVDITAGSLIGTTITFAAYLVFYKNDRPWHALTIQKGFRHEVRA